MKHLKIIFAFILLVGMVSVQAQPTLNFSSSYIFNQPLTASDVLTDSADVKVYSYYVDTWHEFKAEAFIRVDTTVGDAASNWVMKSGMSPNIKFAEAIGDTIKFAGSTDTAFYLFSGTVTRSGTGDTVAVDRALRRQYLFIEAINQDDKASSIEELLIKLTEYSKE